MGMSCLDCHDYMDGYNRGKKEGTIEELEKIRKKIKNDLIIHEEWITDIDDLKKCLCRIDTIVDKEISELKGDKE